MSAVLTTVLLTVTAVGLRTWRPPPGDADARNYRDDLSRQMTPEQIAEARRLSYEWYATHRSVFGV